MSMHLGKTLSFLAGLAAGAGLEYLLDPETGHKRRRRLEQRVQKHVGMRRGRHAISGIGAALGGVTERLGGVTGRLGDVTGRLGSGMSHLGENVSAHLSHLAEMGHRGAQHAGQRMQDGAEDWLGKGSSLFSEAGHALSDKAGALWESMRHRRVSEQEEHETTSAHAAVSLLATAATAIGVGAILMYLMDPEMGRTRRKFAGDKVRGGIHELKETARGRAEDLRNRISGYAQEARSALRSAEPADDRTLEARIRSELGHVSDQVGQITVEVHDGNVTLRGSAADDAAEKLIAAARAISGVQSVEDQLTRT